MHPLFVKCSANNQRYPPAGSRLLGTVVLALDHPEWHSSHWSGVEDVLQEKNLFASHWEPPPASRSWGKGDG